MITDRFSPVFPALLLALVGAALTAGCNKAWAPPAEVPAMNEATAIRQAIDLVRAAQRLEYAGKDKEAMDKYIEAIQAYRETPAAWNNLGRLKMKAGDNMQAAGAFQVATDLTPTDPIAPFNLGQLWESLGYLDEASKWYAESLRRDENYRPALRHAVLVDQIRNAGDETTAARLQRALLVETDPAWKDRLLREEIRLREQLQKQSLPK